MASEGSPKEALEPSKDNREWETAPAKEEKKAGKIKSNLDPSVTSSRSRSGDLKGQHRGSGSEPHREKSGKLQSSGTKAGASLQKQPVASGSHTDYFRDKFETGMRRQHEASATAKHGEEFRLQQAKRAAWARAQTAGAPGNYRNCDSQFGNYLIPVIPNQFFNKSPNSAPASPGSGGFAAPSITGNVGKTFG